MTLKDCQGYRGCIVRFDMPAEESMAKGFDQMIWGDGVVMLTAGGESMVGYRRLVE